MTKTCQEKVGGAREELALSHPDPLVLEFNRLQNVLKEKDRELGTALGEIKGLKASEALKDRAIEELTNEVARKDEKLSISENLLEQKTLEIKKLLHEKKEAIAAQYAAESTLRRVHANLKDDDSPPIESVIAPLEAEIKMYKTKIAALQEDNKALERHTKSKEMALVEAEKILRSALERALIVEEVQNQNYELKRQIEICQEENKILEKTNRQKILEVEKLSQTIKELEETILASGVAANTIRDYQRRISELTEENKMLERELARTRVAANRVATVVANEWKDENDKVMPVKQWLEERRMFQAEMQRLRDKLAVSERTAKAEAQLKEKFKLRLKTLEEGLRHPSSFSLNPNASCGSPKPEKSGNIFGFLTSNGGLRKRSTSQPRASMVTRSPRMQQVNIESGSTNVMAGLRKDSFKKYGYGENVLKKGIWASKTKGVDSNGKENAELQPNTDVIVDKHKNDGTPIMAEIKTKTGGIGDFQSLGGSEEIVSGFLYDRLQKEVINLRKCCETKESILTDKDQEIQIKSSEEHLQMLMRKVNALNKAIEVESKKAKREAAAREKEGASAKVDQTKKMGNMNFYRR